MFKLVSYQLNDIDKITIPRQRRQKLDSYLASVPNRTSNKVMSKLSSPQGIVLSSTKLLIQILFKRCKLMKRIKKKKILTMLNGVEQTKSEMLEIRFHLIFRLFGFFLNLNSNSRIDGGISNLIKTQFLGRLILFNYLELTNSLV